MNEPLRAKSQARTVLLLGNRRSSLAVIRSLHRDGWKPAVGINGREDRNYFVHRSRFVSFAWQHPNWTKDWPAFTAELFRFLSQHPEIAAVYPVDGAGVHRVARLRDRLQQRAIVVLPNPKAVDVCLDKAAMLDTCRQVGVPHASYRVVQSIEAMETACRELGFPCIVKPLDAETLLTGVKALILRDHEQTAACTSLAALDGQRLIVQRYVAGPRHNVHFAALRGKIIGGAEVKTLRTDRIDGTGLTVWGVTVAPSPGLWSDCAKLVEALDYTGVGCAQFLLEQGGAGRSFLELNPRLVGSVAVAERAGLPLASLGLHLAMGESPEPRDPQHYLRGLHFAWTWGALAGCRFQLRERIIGPRQAARLCRQTLLEAVGAGFHMTWSWRDPLPTLLQFARPLMHKATRRAGVDIPGLLRKPADAMEN